MLDTVTLVLVSGFLEFTLFGIFLILSPVSLALLVRRHQRVYTPTFVFKEDYPLWRKRLLRLWHLGRSPLITATVLFMLTITVVGLLYILCPEKYKLEHSRHGMLMHF